jgi:hypothetical protein
VIYFVVFIPDRHHVIRKLSVFGRRYADQPGADIIAELEYQHVFFVDPLHIFGVDRFELVVYNFAIERFGIEEILDGEYQFFSGIPDDRLSSAIFSPISFT